MVFTGLGRNYIMLQCWRIVVTVLYYHSVFILSITPSLGQYDYRDINNGVYRAGFATKQEAYDKAVSEVFAALDRVEEILSRQRYLTGSTLTEADVRLYTTLVRFDMVYVGHFKVSTVSHSHTILLLYFYFSVIRSASWTTQICGGT